MGTSAQYYLHGILIGGATWIGEMDDATPEATVEAITAYGGSSHLPSFLGGMGVRPAITFSTPQIKTILDLCIASGLNCTADLSAGNVDLYYRKAGHFTSREAIGAASHLRIRIPAAVGGKGGACLHWTEVGASQGEVARIQCRLIPTWDETSAPLQALGGQVIAANVLAAEEFGLGPVSLNAAAVDGVTDWSYRPEVNFTEIASGGEDFLSFIGIQQAAPVLSVTTPDLSTWWPAFYNTGAFALPVTSGTWYLRKRKTNSSRAETDASILHISFGLAANVAGLARIAGTSGGSPDPASVTIETALKITNADVDNVLTIDTTSAIT